MTSSFVAEGCDEGRGKGGYKVCEENDMMILVILSHGREGSIDTVEGQPYSLEFIFSRFNNQQCPNLKGKPKFFIVQVCKRPG